MKIIHRIGLHRDNPARPHLERLGIRLVFQHMLGTTVLQVEESDILWEPISAIAKEYRLPAFVSTKFSKKEFEKANLLELNPSWHWSYPQPEDDFAYMEMTYDTKDYCDQCGMGGVQKAPFRVRRQPGWGRHNILQLNWVFDEYFVTPRAYNELFKPMGIGSWHVVKHRDGSVIQDLVQLKIDAVSISSLKIEGYAFEVCSKCRRRKYLPVTRGPHPPFIGDPGDAHILKTQEYFGSGGSAFRGVIITKNLYNSMVKYGMNGVIYSPVGEFKDYL